MKYKVIKGVAHDFGHAFVSLTNYVADDYVMDHLARAAAASGEPELRVDLLTGAAEPAALVVPLVRASLDMHAAWLPGKLREHGVRPEQLREATLSVRSDLSRLRSPALPRVMLPLVCQVELTDDRGIVHVGTVRSEWPVEKGEEDRGLS
ncbi:hypothetical protein [Longimicrobium sp.]|uniref:hypothetical protein n=1 Tax=Longimicrobium sp. TaxID=2029185 RepID=UPI003B3A010A